VKHAAIVLEDAWPFFQGGSDAHATLDDPERSGDAGDRAGLGSNL
jgi:hypothetical protein